MKEINGNIIDLATNGEFDIIAHGCNCQKTMGAGLALQIKTQLPAAWRADYEDKRINLSRWGDFTWAECVSINPERDFRFLVLNLYTQFMPGANFDYTAMCLILKKINIQYAGISIAFPQIGCGIGGGDWKRVKAMINRFLPDMDVTIVYYKK